MVLLGRDLPCKADTSGQGIPALRGRYRTRSPTLGYGQSAGPGIHVPVATALLLLNAALFVSMSIVLWVHMEARGQLAQVGSLFLPRSPGD